MGFETAIVFDYSEVPAGAFKCCRFVVMFDKDRRDEVQGPVVQSWVSLTLG
jgi:hypothetical protein